MGSLRLIQFSTQIRRITIHDDALNSLRSSGDHWEGKIHFLGSDLPFLVEFDTYDPTDDDRRVARESVKTTLPLLTQKWERQARYTAAAEVVDAACSQSAVLKSEDACTAEQPEEPGAAPMSQSRALSMERLSPRLPRNLALLSCAIIVSVVIFILAGGVFA